jgi:hypothetical protein
MAEWRNIPGTVGYEVSDEGEVRSYYNPKTHKLTNVPRLKKLSRMRTGWKVCVKGKGCLNVGRLVLEAFVGPCPEGLECCHGEKGGFNNSFNNLSWNTMLKNQGPDKRRDGKTGALLTEEEVKTIKEMLPNFTNTEIAEVFGVTHSYISGIRRGKSFSWVKVDGALETAGRNNRKRHPFTIDSRMKMSMSAKNRSK